MRRRRARWVGRCPGYEVALLDPDGVEASEGEIALSLEPAPLGLMDGYQAEDGTLRGVEGKWYRTGDTAMRNADGSLTYIGRADDVFKSSGYRISPFELESVLIEHPAVAEAAIVPSPDPTRTALPKAFVLLDCRITRRMPPPPRASSPIFVPGLRRIKGPPAGVRRAAQDDQRQNPPVELRRLEAGRRSDGCTRGELEFLEEELA